MSVFCDLDPGERRAVFVADGRGQETVEHRAGFLSFSPEGLKALGGQKPTDFYAWDPARAIGAHPGLFIQDERPGGDSGDVPQCWRTPSSYASSMTKPERRTLNLADVERGRLNAVWL
ncbi:MAG TPA: hypothetical protein VMU73_02845 [Gaiellaceae bacterium]|nr:hypothetical protein [Gaiellaceae bacterium]